MIYKYLNECISSIKYAFYGCFGAFELKNFFSLYEINRQRVKKH